MVTKIYKRELITIRNLKIKVVSVILATLFTFSGAAIAHAEEPTISYAQAPSSFAQEVQSGFDIISSVSDATQKKNDCKVKVSKLSATSALLSWESDELCISYKVCRFDVIKNSWVDLISTPSNKLRLRDLKPNTEYKYCVIGAATGELIGVKAFTTKMQKPVVSIKERSGDTVKVGLDNLQKGSRVTLYRKEGSGKYKKIANLSSKKKTFTDKELKSATTYYYKAKSVVTTKKNGKKATKKSVYSKAKKATTLLSMGLPSVSGRTKTYAFYTAVTLRSSPQYKLLNSDECYTDEETGIRMVDGCYCVALGSYYGTKIGTKYRITFSTGTKIDVILCDQKADRHTDSKHQYAVNNSDIVEFYVERAKMPRAIRNRGNYGILEKFSGSIVAIEKYV